MKQTWKWAMMLFMAFTFAIGTTSCSSDDDEAPMKLIGKWALVHRYSSSSGQEWEDSYSPEDSHAYLEIKSSTFIGYYYDYYVDEWEKHTENFEFKDDKIVFKDFYYDVDVLTEQRLVLSADVYDIFTEEEYIKVKKFPWE